MAVGRISELKNEKRIKESASRSLADSVIEKLPDGYQQRIGRWFKRGTNLSGGEWQKIAIARAYMRDAQMLILEEIAGQKLSNYNKVPRRKVFTRASKLQITWDY